MGVSDGFEVSFKNKTTRVAMNKTVKISLVLILMTSHLLYTGIHAAVVHHLLLLLLVIAMLGQHWNGENKKYLKMSTPDILMVVFVLYLFLNNAFQGSFVGNKSLYDFLSIFLLYFGIRFLVQNNKSILRYIFYGILVTVFLEIMTSFGQIFRVLQNSDAQFVFGGLFGNPGALAGYLSITAPFMLFVILNYKKFFQSENLYYFIVCCFASAVYLIIVANSRGAWIASFVGLYLVLNQKYKLSKYLFMVGRIKSSIGLLMIVVIALAALYNYKPDSAFGRLFIWKTSIPMIAENSICGNGFGSFENDYGKVQAKYFLENTPAEKEVNVADYVTCAYNEILEMVVDSGFAGLVIFLLIIYFACKTRLGHHSEYYFAKYSLVALMILGMFSYPFDLMPNLFMFAIFLSIIFTDGNYTALQLKSNLILSVWALVLFCLVYLSSLYTYGIYHFQNGYKEILAHDIENGLEDYKYAEKYLKNTGIFHFHYGSALYLNKDYHGSVNHLIKSTELCSDPHAFIMLGNSLKALKRYEQAEKAYETASGITPSKLYPKYLLANLYVEMGLHDDAVRLAEKIVGMSEKVKTTAGSEIKQEMGLLIKNCKNIRKGKVYDDIHYR
ncbi:hypothetical protein GF406_06045 [candidate division KSB1 bacterium]|nr:hypothetical protein [candidate division KSB1 bacterium]